LCQLPERADVFLPIPVPAVHQLPDRLADLPDVIEMIDRIGPHTPVSPDGRRDGRISLLPTMDFGHKIPYFMVNLFLPHRLSLPVTFMVYFSPTQVTLVSNPTENPM